MVPSVPFVYLGGGLPLKPAWGTVALPWKRSQDGGLLRKAERCLRTAVRLASNRSSAARIYLASDNEQFRARIVEKYPVCGCVDRFP